MVAIGGRGDAGARRSDGTKSSVGTPSGPTATGWKALTRRIWSDRRGTRGRLRSPDDLPPVLLSPADERGGSEVAARRGGLAEGYLDSCLANLFYPSSTQRLTTRAHSAAADGWSDDEIPTPAHLTPLNNTSQHELQLTTDQKVGDSSSPGRADETPAYAGASMRV